MRQILITDFCYNRNSLNLTNKELLKNNKTKEVQIFVFVHPFAVLGSI